MKRMISRRRYSIKVATVVVATASLIVACGRNVNNGGFKPRKNGTSTLGIYPGKPGPGSFAKLSPEQKSLRLRQIIAKVLMQKSEAEVNDLEGLNRLLPESAAEIILGVSAQLGLSGSPVDTTQVGGAVSGAGSAVRESLMRSNILAVIGPQSEARSIVVSGEFDPDKNYMQVESGGVEFRAACYEGCDNLILLITKDNAQAGFLFKIDRSTGAAQIVSSTLGSRFRTFEDAKNLVVGSEGVARTIVNPPIPPTPDSPVIRPGVSGRDSDGSSQQPPSDDQQGDRPIGEMDPPPAADDKAVTPPASDDKAVTPPAAGEQTETSPPPVDDSKGKSVALSSRPQDSSTIKKYDVLYPDSGTGAPELAAPPAEDKAAKPAPKPDDLADNAATKPSPVSPPRKPTFIVSETWDKMKALARQGVEAVIAAVPKSKMGGDFDQSLAVYTSLTGIDSSKLSTAEKKALLELFQQHYHDTIALRIPYFQISLDRSSERSALGVDLAISDSGIDLRQRSDEGMNVALDAEILKGKTVVMDIKDVNGSPNDVRISLRCLDKCKEVVSELWYGENNEHNSFNLKLGGLYRFVENGKSSQMKLTYSTSGYSWTGGRFESLISLETIANDCVAKVGKVKDCPVSAEPAGSTKLDAAKLCEIDNAQLLEKKEICSKGFKNSVSDGFLEIYKGLAERQSRGTEEQSAQQVSSEAPSKSTTTPSPKAAATKPKKDTMDKPRVTPGSGDTKGRGGAQKTAPKKKPKAKKQK